MPTTLVTAAALGSYLALRQPSQTRFRLKLLTKKGRRIQGVNVADRQSLYERMEGRA